MATDTLLPPPELEAPVGQVDRALARSDGLPEFRAGDIILFAGRRDWYGVVSRWIMRSRGEAPTYAVHTAQFVDPERYLELDVVGKLRATGDILNKRQAHDMWRRRGFEVWRCPSLTPEQLEAVSDKAMNYLGRRFGFAKFSTHLLDGLLSKVVGRNIFFVRRLNHDQRYPICSWITAFSYDRAVHYHFGVPPEVADPDQIDDWVSTHPQEWERVFRLDYS